MAYRAIVCAVGIYFMEDILHFIKKCSCSLHEACIRHLIIKRKSVIVRKIGSYITWVHAPRLHVASLHELKGIQASDDDSSLKCNCLSDTSSEGPSSSVHLENRIEELEKELLRLQMQVSNILLKTDSKDTQSSSEIDDSTVSSSTKEVCPSLPPIPPPPPPPPLPPSPLVQTRTVLVKVKPKSAEVVEKGNLSTIMEELSKRPPKLRHVERSPGGRPVRNTPAPYDPSDVLAAVLRKRFEATHGEKQDCYMLSPENVTKTPMITGH